MGEVRAGHWGNNHNNIKKAVRFEGCIFRPRYKLEQLVVARVTQRVEESGNGGNKWPDPWRTTKVGLLAFCCPFTGIIQPAHTSVPSQSVHRQNPHVPTLLQAGSVTAVHAGGRGFMAEAYPIYTANVEKAGQLPHAWPWQR